MINATKKWIFLKISGAILVPLMTWFILNFITIYDQDYFIIVSFFTNAYFFSALSISEVFEDYVKNSKIKNVANRLLYTSAVVIPLITIILVSRL